VRRRRDHGEPDTPPEIAGLAIEVESRVVQIAQAAHQSAAAEAASRAMRTVATPRTKAQGTRNRCGSDGEFAGHRPHPGSMVEVPFDELRKTGGLTKEAEAQWRKTTLWYPTFRKNRERMEHGAVGWVNDGDSLRAIHISESRCGHPFRGELMLGVRRLKTEDLERAAPQSAWQTIRIFGDAHHGKDLGEVR